MPLTMPHALQCICTLFSVLLNNKPPDLSNNQLLPNFHLHQAINTKTDVIFKWNLTFYCHIVMYHHFCFCINIIQQYIRCTPKKQMIDSLRRCVIFAMFMSLMVEEISSRIIKFGLQFLCVIVKVIPSVPLSICNFSSFNVMNCYRSSLDESEYFIHCLYGRFMGFEVASIFRTDMLTHIRENWSADTENLTVQMLLFQITSVQVQKRLHKALLPLSHVFYFQGSIFSLSVTEGGSVRRHSPINNHFS